MSSVSKLTAKLYYAYFNEPLPSADFSHLLNGLPEKFVREIMSYRRWEDAHACLLGKCLIKKAFSEYDLSLSLNSIKFNNYGKPYISDSFHFNVRIPEILLYALPARQRLAGIV